MRLPASNEVDSLNSVSTIASCHGSCEKSLTVTNANMNGSPKKVIRSNAQAVTVGLGDGTTKLMQERINQWHQAHWMRNPPSLSQKAKDCLELIDLALSMPETADVLSVGLPKLRKLL